MVTSLLLNKTADVMCFCTHGNSVSRTQSEAYLPSNQGIENLTESASMELRHQRRCFPWMHRIIGRVNEKPGDEPSLRNSQIELPRDNVIMRELSFSPGAARRLFGSRFLPRVSRFGEREVGSRPQYCHPLTLDVICHDEYSVCSAFWGVDEESDSDEDNAIERNYGCDENNLSSLRDETSNSCSIDKKT